MIHFDEIKSKVIEYLKEREKDNKNPVEFYVIRDVYGKVSIYVIGEYDLECLKQEMTELIGENWIGQVRRIDKTHILYGEVSKSVQKIENNLYYGERPLVKKNWNYNKKENKKEEVKVITFYSYKGASCIIQI